MTKRLPAFISDRSKGIVLGTLTAVYTLALLSVASLSSAQVLVGVNFTIVADNLTAAPSDPGATFTDFSAPSIDDDGNIAFFAFSSSQNEGVYTYIDGALDVVADKSTLIPPDNQTTFPGFRLAPGQIALGSRQLSIDDGKVAFDAAVPGVAFETGFYTNADGESLEQVALGDNLPGNFAQSFTRPWLDNGEVAYIGRPILQDGSFGNAVINVFDSASDTTTPWFVSGDQNLVHHPSFSGGGISVETSMAPTILGIITEPITDPMDIDPVVQTAFVDPGTPVPKKPGVEFASFSTFPVLDNNADIAFFGTGTDFLNGIYKRIGGTLDVVADTNTPIPGGAFVPGGPTEFEYFNPQISIANGSVIFRGNVASDGGLFTDLSGALDAIAILNEDITIGSDSFRLANFAIGTEAFAKTPTGYSAVFLAFLDGGTCCFPAIVRADIATGAPVVWDSGSGFDYSLNTQVFDFDAGNVDTESFDDFVEFGALAQGDPLQVTALAALPDFLTPNQRAESSTTVELVDDFTSRVEVASHCMIVESSPPERTCSAAAFTTFDALYTPATPGEVLIIRLFGDAEIAAMGGNASATASDNVVVRLFVQNERTDAFTLDNTIVLNETASVAGISDPGPQHYFFDQTFLVPLPPADQQRVFINASELGMTEAWSSSGANTLTLNILVPEPASSALSLAAVTVLGGLWYLRRKKRRV